MNPNQAKPEREDRLVEVLMPFVEALEAGQEPDRAALLAAHPDLHDDLVAFFASHDEVVRMTAPLRVPNEPRVTSQHESITASGSSDSIPQSTLGRLGDFLLIREVGRGGMGIVYEAEQISLRRRVALKVLPFAAAIDPRQLQRFKNEATSAAHLRHENIVPVFAVGSERGVHYYAMQFIEGQSLAALIAELRTAPRDRLAGAATGTISTAQMGVSSTERPARGFDWVARQGRQAALALEHAHQTGIVHRDIKPGNLLLDPNDQLWVTDFGLAQVSGDSGLTATGELLGTLRYASPEQALGRRGVVDHRSDVYSLGATLYELLTLQPPFDGADRRELLAQIADQSPPSLRSINPAIPANLETIVLKSLRKEPAERYATAQELADDLQRYLERKPVLAKHPGFTEKFRMWARRHPSALIACAVVLLLVTVGSLFSVALLRTEQARTRKAQERAQGAYERERERAEQAEVRLALARRAVDELFRVSEEELADRPGMEMPRKRLLLSALTHYRELLEERRDDPSAQAELRSTSDRVEKILADLAIVRAATHFYLLCQPVVLDDLQLSSKQRTEMKEFTTRVGKDWWKSVRDNGKATPAERNRRTVAQARTQESDLNVILTTEQRTRLKQIGLQSEGVNAFRDPEVAAALELTADQRDKIHQIEAEAAFAWMRGPNNKVNGKSNQSSEPREPSINQRIMTVLTDSQVNRWHELTGKPLEGGLVPFGPFMPPPPSASDKPVEPEDIR